MEGTQKARAPKIHISPSGLEATITFSMPKPGEESPHYTDTEITALLREKGVTFGILHDEIAKLATNVIYERPILVAKGIIPQDATPGYYIFNFETKLNKKPVINEDGSTDYMNIKTIEVVHKDDVIATYVPSVRGVKGMSVKGTVVDPKPAREMPPLAGRGFTRSDDNRTYTATMDGKIEKKDNRILISPVHEIRGDADITTGNIDFNGDVVVHGGASDGVIIKAAGNVTIEGLVESCEIYAGKDLFLLSGTKGGEKTVIDVKGNITAQFIEYALVKCKGSITADYMFKSKVVCDGRIDLTGNKSAIIGGQVSAVQGLETNEIGNDFGTITNVSVGVDQERLMAAENLSRKIDALASNVDKIKKGLADFDKLSEERGIDYSNDPRRLQLLRVKIRDEAIVFEEQGKLDEMRAVMEKGKNSTIKVFKKIHAGANIAIDTRRVTIKDEQKNVEFVKTATGIRMQSMDEL